MVVVSNVLFGSGFAGFGWAKSPAAVANIQSPQAILPTL